MEFRLRVRPTFGKWNIRTIFYSNYLIKLEWILICAGPFFVLSPDMAILVGVCILKYTRSFRSARFFFLHWKHIDIRVSFSIIINTHYQFTVNMSIQFIHTKSISLFYLHTHTQYALLFAFCYTFPHEYCIANGKHNRIHELLTAVEIAIVNTIFNRRYMSLNVCMCIVYVLRILYLYAMPYDMRVAQKRSKFTTAVARQNKNSSNNL